ncbi:MAG: hypothetical protein WHV63_06970 [Ignavibacteria bacterium]
MNFFRPFWLDEIYTLLQINVPNILILLSNFYQGTDTNPPFYFLFFYALKNYFQIEEKYFRLISYIFTTSGIALLYFNPLLKKYREEVLIITLVSPFILFYLSSEVRAYPLIFFLGSVLLLIISRDNISSIKKHSLIALICFLLLFTHYYSLFYVLVIFIVQIKSLLGQRKYKEIFIYLMPVLIFIIWIPAIQNQIKSVNSYFWQNKVSLNQLILFPKFFFGKTLLVVIPFLIFSLFNFTFKDKFRYMIKYQEFYIILLGWLLIPYIIGLLSFFIDIPFVERYFTLSFFPFVIGIVYIIPDKINIRWLQITLMSLILINIWNIFVNYKKIEKEKEILNKRLSLLQKGNVICESPHVFYPLNYYSKNQGIYRAYFVLDLESASIKGNIKNALFDYYGNKYLRKYFYLPQVLEWNELNKKLNQFFIIDEPNRMFFEYRILNRSDYKLNEIEKNIFWVQK